MKSGNSLGCSGLAFLGVIGIIVSFFMSNFWIIIITLVIIGIIIISIISSSNKNQNNINHNIQSLPDITKTSDSEKSFYSVTSKDNNKKHDSIDVAYSKVEGAPNNYVVFDLETTGLKYSSDVVLEIGAIKYIDDVETDRFLTYVKTTKTIPDYITKINGITFSTIKDAPMIRSALKDFIDFIGDYTLIAYNSDFDMSFLQYNCKTKLNKTVENDVIDALPLARKYLSELPNKKLETVKQHFKLKVGSHNAIDDCIVTNHLYQYCKQYEADRFKYVIPFTYEFQELNDTEVEYLNTVVEILEKNGIKKSEIGMIYTSKFLRLYDKREDRFSFDIRIKMYGKLKYVLLDIPLSRFESESDTEIKYTEGSSDEKGKTRLFTENPQQLWRVEKYIVNKQRHWSIY